MVRKSSSSSFLLNQLLINVQLSSTLAVPCLFQSSYESLSNHLEPLRVSINPLAKLPPVPRRSAASMAAVVNLGIN